MKRDMDLIRAMVLAANDHPHGFLGRMVIDGFTPESIGYHAYLLVDSGMAVGTNRTCMGNAGPMWELSKLTSAGHDYIDSIQSDYIWNEVKSEIQKKGLVSAGLDVMKKITDKLIRQRLEIW